MKQNDAKRKRDGHGMGGGKKRETKQSRKERRRMTGRGGEKEREGVGGRRGAPDHWNHSSIVAGPTSWGSIGDQQPINH